MELSFDIDILHQRCTRLPRLAGLAHGEFQVLRRKGTSNDHVRLGESGLVARVPRFSHGGFDAATNLSRQAAAFAHAAPSGHTPALFDTLPNGDGLPGGALIVEFIDGRAPRLPGDMAAIAQALAALHTLPVPPPAQCEPLPCAADPVAATLEAIERHAVCLPALFQSDAGLDAASLAALDADIDWARGFAATAMPNLPPRFVGADTHPGNFLIDGDGKAWFVDLEKAHYGAVPIDLAHASLPTSTGWDPDVAGSLSDDDIRAFYAGYLSRVGAPFAAELAPWLLPMRRLTWLRTMTFLARWRVDWSHNPDAGSRDPDMDRHIAAHIAHCFAAETIAATRREWRDPDIRRPAG